MKRRYEIFVAFIATDRNNQSFSGSSSLTHYVNPKRKGRITFGDIMEMQEQLKEAFDVERLVIVDYKYM